MPAPREQPTGMRAVLNVWPGQCVPGVTARLAKGGVGGMHWSAPLRAISARARDTTGRYCRWPTLLVARHSRGRPRSTDRVARLRASCCSGNVGAQRSAVCWLTLLVKCPGLPISRRRHGARLPDCAASPRLRLWAAPLELCTPDVPVGRSVVLCADQAWTRCHCAMSFAPRAEWRRRRCSHGR